MKSLFLGLCIICFGLISTLRDPFWGVTVFCLFTHITPQQLSNAYITPLRAPLVISLLVLFSYLISSKYKYKFSLRPLELWLMVIMAIGMLLGTINAINPQFIYLKLTVFLKYILFLLLIVNIIDSEYKINWFTNGLIMSSAWLVYRCWDLRGAFSGRFENIDGNIVADSNHFAAALVLLLPLTISRMISANWKIKVFAAIGLFGIVISIIISGSRGGFLGLAVETIALLYFFKKQRKKILICLTLSCFLMSFFITDHYIERVSGIFSPHEIEDQAAKGSAESRLMSWALAFDLWKENPIIGCGIGNFGYYMGVLEGHGSGELGHVTHSLWLQILSEGGLSVFLPFAALIICFFSRLRRVTKNYENSDFEHINYNIYALQAGMIGFLTSATFINRLFYETIYWWFGLAVVHTVVQEKLLINATKPINKIVNNDK